MPNPIRAPHDLRLRGKDLHASTSSRSSRLPTGGSAGSPKGHHPSSYSNHDGSHPASPRLSSGSYGNGARSSCTSRSASGSPAVSRRSSPRMGSGGGGKGTTMTGTSRDNARGDVVAGEDKHTRQFPEQAGNRMGSASRKDMAREMEGGDTGELSEDSGRIRVAVRVRPFSEKEKLAGDHGIITMTGNQTRIIDPAYFDSQDGPHSPSDRSMWERTFNFDHSFWSHSRRRTHDDAASATEYSGQADVHLKLGRFLLDNACKGYNCSLFAYGQTGSGKTHTMLGDSSDLTTAAGPGEAGLIPRICIEMFQRLGLASTDAGTSSTSCRGGQASIQVSFCEIYNEQVRDLFAQGSGDGQGLRVREHPSKGAFVEGLSARPVTCYQQVQQLLDAGMSARSTAATAMNEMSSRSHAIFTIAITVTTITKFGQPTGLEQEKDDGGDRDEDVSVRKNKICLVDLAGSERANSTGAKGDRLREASNINKSLSTLGDDIVVVPQTFTARDQQARALPLMVSSLRRIRHYVLQNASPAQVIKALAKRGESGRGSAGNGNSGNESFIPYRNSMLTWLLKDSIGGNSKTVMLAAISPVAGAYQETMSTLRYVERAKDIVNTTTVNDASSNPLIGKLREEVRVLRELLIQKDAIILEHEEKEVVLSAALERERADDGDEMQRALATADSLQAALHREERRGAEAATAAAAASFESAATTERLHRQELASLVEEQRDRIEALREAHKLELDTSIKEHRERHAEEVDTIRKQAAVETSQAKEEWADASKAEKAVLEKQHMQDVSRLREEHKAATEKIAVEAESSMTKLNDEHTRDLAERHSAAEARTSDELNRLRQEMKGERDQAIAEALASAEVQKTDAITEAVSNANAAASAALAAAADAAEVELCEMREKHAEEFVRLRNDLEDTARRIQSAAVDEERKQLRAEMEQTLAAAMAKAVAKRDRELQQQHRDQAKRAQEDYLREANAAQVALRDEHKREMEMVIAEQTTSIAAEKGRHREELTLMERGHMSDIEEIRKTEEAKHTVELAAAAEEHAAVIEAGKSEHMATLTSAKHEHQQELDICSQTHQAQIASLTAAMATEREERGTDAEQLQKSHMEALERANKKWEEQLNALSIAAEHRRCTDLQAAEKKFEETLADVRAELEALIATDNEKHRNEIRLAKHRNTSDIEEIRAAEEAKRTAQLAAAAEEHAARIEAAKSQHMAALASEINKHQEELDRCSKTHHTEVASLNGAMTTERDERAADAENLRNSHSLLVESIRAKAVAAAATQESKHQEAIAALMAKHETEMNDCVESSTASLAASIRKEHARELEVLKSLHDDEVARVAREGEEQRSSDANAATEKLAKVKVMLETHHSGAIAALEAKYSDELRTAEEQREAEKKEAAAETVAIAGAAEKEAKRYEDETKSTAEKYKEELRKLGEERTAQAELVAACEEERRQRAVSAVESQCASSVDAVKAESAAEMAALEKRYQEDIRRADKDRRERKLAAEAELNSALESLRSEHQRELKVTADERDAAISQATAAVEAQRKADIGIQKRLRATAKGQQASMIAAARDELAAKHGQELSRIREKQKNDIRVAAEAAEEKRIEDLKVLSEGFAVKLTAVEKEGAIARDAQKANHHLELLAERASHEAAVALIKAEQAKYIAEGETKARERLAAVESDLQARLTVAREKLAEEASTVAAVEAAAEAANRDHDIERQWQLDTLGKKHAASLSDLEERWSKRYEELLRRTENAEAATEGAKASADEASTRAESLEGMLKATVGSRDDELAGHRTRLAQLQAFVSRREQAEDAQYDGSGVGGQIAGRSVQQRIIDLKAMVAGVGAAMGSTITGGSKPGSFASRDLTKGPGLTLEQYAEELEEVLIRATAETAAARQDHLEVDMQLKSVTRQLVGLKTRERLEDTQIKLEYKSQSAARRWLASAQRLAHEISRPDRHSLASLSPRSRSKTPAAMATNNNDNKGNNDNSSGSDDLKDISYHAVGQRSPITKRGSKSPRPQQHQRVSSTDVIIDIGNNS